MTPYCRVSFVSVSLSPYALEREIVPFLRLPSPPNHHFARSLVDSGSGFGFIARSDHGFGGCLIRSFSHPLTHFLAHSLAHAYSFLDGISIGHGSSEGVAMEQDAGDDQLSAQRVVRSQPTSQRRALEWLARTDARAHPLTSHLLDHALFPSD